MIAFIQRYWPPLPVTALFMAVSISGAWMGHTALENATEARRLARINLVANQPWYTNNIASVEVITYIPDKADPIAGQKQVMKVRYEDGTSFSTDNMKMISVMLLHMPRDRMHRTFEGRRT